VDVDVDLSHKGLTEIPIKFGVVKGSFFINNNKLTSLENSPREVEVSFKCSENKNLTSLKGGPSIADFYKCTGCNLTSLEGGPNQVTHDFYCSGNEKLTSLKYAPEKVGYIDCSGCSLTSLEGAPKEAKGFICSGQVNGHKFTEEDVRKVCNVKYRIIA
jgi:hypothetical protein